MSLELKPGVVIRRAKPEDAAACGLICYQAFAAISGAHSFPCDLPGPEAAVGLLSSLFAAPGFYCVVAECDGVLAGSNCLDERSVIRGLGPITVDPAIQNRGVGRALMDAAMGRVEQSKAVGIRLVQAAFHNRSFSLYATLGFDLREPLACMQGKLTLTTIAGCTVRPASESDLAACNALSLRVHGFDRSGELAHAITQGTAKVVIRDAAITGYTTHLGFFGHTTCASNLDLQALIAAADELAGPGILVPSRNAELLRWCLAHGLRVVQPMTLMSKGLYNDPAGAFLPSILF
jgi:GNAT superfamily N-acetyltransferase